jgi:uncharacterized membrane protein
MVWINEMTLAGRLHPLLLHFPIALLVFAAAAEVAALLTKYPAWHVVAVVNLRVGAASAAITAITGWLLASSLHVDDVRALEWHRWIGVVTTAAVIGAALATAGDDSQSRRVRWLYRVALFWAAALVAVTGHLGARLVWGADFLRP